METNKVYVVTTESLTPTEHLWEVVGVYKTKEKVREILKKLYDEDIEWIIGISDCSVSDLDRNYISSMQSGVKKGDYYSYNNIDIFNIWD